MNYQKYHKSILKILGSKINCPYQIENININNNNIYYNLILYVNGCYIRKIFDIEIINESSQNNFDPPESSQNYFDPPESSQNFTSNSLEAKENKKPYGPIDGGSNNNASTVSENTQTILNKISEAVSTAGFPTTENNIMIPYSFDNGVNISTATLSVTLFNTKNLVSRPLGQYNSANTTYSLIQYFKELKQNYKSVKFRHVGYIVNISNNGTTNSYVLTL